MRLSDFKKLEESVQEQDFNKSFKNINKVMFFLSIFGHFASIFLSYFLLSKVLSGVIENTIVIGVTSVILLGGLELLKREIFDKFSLQQIKYKSVFNKDVLPLAIVSLIVVAISFYSSIGGAKEFSNKSKQIETQVEFNIKTYEDSLSKAFNVKIDNVCKVNGIILLNKDMVDLFKLFTSLGIIRSSGSSKYIGKSKEISQEILKKHFNID